MRCNAILYELRRSMIQYLVCKNLIPEKSSPCLEGGKERCHSQGICTGALPSAWGLWDKEVLASNPHTSVRHRWFCQDTNFKWSFLHKSIVVRKLADSSDSCSCFFCLRSFTLQPPDNLPSPAAKCATIGVLPGPQLLFEYSLIFTRLQLLG